MSINVIGKHGGTCNKMLGADGSQVFTAVTVHFRMELYSRHFPTTNTHQSIGRCVVGIRHGFFREESGNNIAALDVFFAVQMQLP